MAVEIHTFRTGLAVRQLATEADDVAYFRALDVNRETLTELGDETPSLYPTLESVRDVRLNPDNPTMLLGIWKADSLIGGLSLTKERPTSAKIDYWLDPSHPDPSDAAVALRALARNITRSGSTAVYAYAREEKEAIFDRAGFQLQSRDIGQAVFSMSYIAPQETLSKRPFNFDAASNPIEPDPESLENLPNFDQALQGKNRAGISVILSKVTGTQDYMCWHCESVIPRGGPYVRLSIPRKSNGYLHHPLHEGCAAAELEYLSEVQIIKAEQAPVPVIKIPNRAYKKPKGKTRRRRR